MNEKQRFENQVKIILDKGLILLVKNKEGIPCDEFKLLCTTPSNLDTDSNDKILVASLAYLVSINIISIKAKTTYLDNELINKEMVYLLKKESKGSLPNCIVYCSIKNEYMFNDSLNDYCLGAYKSALNFLKEDYNEL